MGRITTTVLLAGALAGGSWGVARADHRASDYGFVLTPNPGSSVQSGGAVGSYPGAGATIVEDEAGRLLLGTPGYRIPTHGGRGYISQSPRYYYLPPTSYGDRYGFYGSPRSHSSFGYADDYYPRSGYGGYGYGSGLYDRGLYGRGGSGFSFQYSRPGFSIGIGNGGYRYGGYGYGGYGRRGYDAFGPGYRGPGVW